MSTYIQGIGASENLDSSGEVVSIDGLDISSLTIDGVLNWEHKSDAPAQVVGKILKAKKIFSDADCEDENQLKFWEKVKVPYLYIMGELFDDYSDSAREVAAKFRYDADHKNQNERPVMNFSVEGSKISKEGMVVTRSIARKITLTVLPCNKQAIAEMVVANKNSDEEDELFKTESKEIEVFMPKPDFWHLLKKEDPEKHAAKLGIKPFKKGYPPVQYGASNALSGSPPIGGSGLLGGAGLMASEKNPRSTSGSESVKSIEKGPGSISGSEHRKAADTHYKASLSAKDPKIAQLHQNKMRQHLHAAEAAEKMQHAPSSSYRPKTSTTQKFVDIPGPGRGMPKSEKITKKEVSQPLMKPYKSEAQRRWAHTTAGKKALGGEKNVHEWDEATKGKKLPEKVKKNDMSKALTAGSALAGPAALVQGAALGGKAMKPKTPVIKPQNISRPDKGYGAIIHKNAASEVFLKKCKKSEMLQRAETEYANWNKREQFEAFMHSRMPQLTKMEIQVIGQTMLLQKSLKTEKKLKKMFPAYNYQNSYVAKKEK